mmetsp:Transcript_30346/g.29680  ORF Transcript_30346/g.29680 Transcript_30346/m.29680 type:complete len:173 (+) Transcript_30346:726-1244(+)
MKQADARKDYYQRNLRLQKLEQLFPTIIEEFNKSAPYDIQLIFDQEYYKKVIKNAKPSSLKIGKNGEATMILNTALAIAIDNNTLEEMLQTISGKKKTSEVDWTIGRTVLFPIQIKGKVGLEQEGDTYNLTFELKSIDVPQVRVFKGEPLAEKAKRSALSEEQLENEESLIN